MTQEHPEITSSRIGARATIMVAIIGLIGIVATAIFNPLGQKLIGSSATPDGPKSLALEQIPVLVLVYDGRDQNLGGWSWLGISFDHSMPSYHFSYSIPADQTGYAGMAFQFEDSQNLSAYQRIEFTVQFDENETEHVIDLYLRDISGKKSHVRLTELGGGEKKESELLSNFLGVNLNAIDEITFNIDNTFIAGDHQLIVSNLRLVP